MFGLGIQELLLLGVFAAAVAVIVFIIVRASGGSSAGGLSAGSDRIASLEDENRRLRAELDDLRGKRDRPI